MATALTSLNIVGNEDVAKLTSSNEIDFKELRKKKTIYYLQIPQQDIKMYAPLISLFYTQFFNSMMKELPKKDDLDIFCLLDES
ncbi:type IV secretory system conjugative DNA transfer family protein [Flavobacteriaceae bacterium]|nr:type IV secretory system conjugative DNA transfer family protein [Flavobacteriaceae bacterium]